MMKVFEKNCGIVLLTIASVGFVFFMGCAKKRQSDEQPKGELEVPSFGAVVKPAFLTGGSETSEYSGSFIVWNPDASKDQIAEVIRASKNYSQTYANQLIFERDRLRPVEREVTKLESDLQKAQSEKNLSLLTVRSTAASRWFEERLNGSMLSGLDDMDRVQARAVFEAFCEGAIWKMATTTSFVKSRFVSVPTPLALCRGVYESKGLLRPDTAACAPAESAAGKGYFSCFWNEGVVKTTLFQRYGARLPEMLSIDINALEQSIAGNLSFWEKILRQMSVTIGDRVISFKIEGQTITSSATLATAPVDMILGKSISTSLLVDHADALGLVSVKRTDRDGAVIPLVDKFREEIRIFWTQLNDSKLNEPLLVKELAAQGEGTVVAQGSTADQTPYIAIFEGTDPAAEQKVSEAHGALTAKERQLGELNVLAGPIVEGQSCASLPDNLTCKTRLAQETQAAAVQIDGVGLAMATGAELVVHRGLNESLGVVLTLSSRESAVKQLRVCLDGSIGTTIDRTQCEWPDRLTQKDDLSEDLIDRVEISLDRENGKLSFAFDPVDLDSIGLAPKARKTGQLDFNIVEASRWLGKRVTFDLYPTELDAVLSIYSGSGKVKDDQESLATTVSLTSVISQEEAFPLK